MSAGSPLGSAEGALAAPVSGRGRGGPGGVDAGGGGGGGGRIGGGCLGAVAPAAAFLLALVAAGAGARAIFAHGEVAANEEVEVARALRCVRAYSAFIVRKVNLAVRLPAT